ncbi:MAG TPA: tetratricopeptide repeat protein [Spirochaetota bacterium]|mgnify:CR=1 FL=1|nr:tetratricopeptide repeat protein [Spirochaetota bacterium]
MNKNDFTSKIINLQKLKLFNEANLLTDEALVIFPCDFFFIKSKIYILSRLNNNKEAYDYSIKYFDLLKKDNFFLKGYVYTLERLKLKEEIAKLTEEYFLKNNILDEANYVEISNILKKNGFKELSEELLNFGLFNLPESKIISERITQKSNNNDAGLGYNEIKNRFSDMGPDEAICEIENMTSLQKYANDPNLNLFLADLYKKQNNIDKAIETYKKVLSVKDGDFTRKLLGYLYYKKNDYHNAIVYLKEIFLKEPDDNILVSTITKIYKNIYDKEKYIDLLNEALARNPNSKKLYGRIKKASEW